MKNQIMTVPSSSFQGGTIIGVILCMAVLAAGLRAQNGPPLPPIPELPTTQPPREPTPAELEAQRKAQEELWQKNREAILPYLQIAPAPEPVDLIQRQRLMSAEQQLRQQKKETRAQRRVDLLNWSARVGEEQRVDREKGEALAKRYGWTLRSETQDGSGVDVYMMGDQLVFQTSYNEIAAKTISTDKARTNAPTGWGITGNGVNMGLWDAGVVGTNHTEFTTGGVARVVWADTNLTADPTGHATAMSGTMVAAGVDAAARGMAFDGRVLAYNSAFDTSKMAEASVIEALRLSNHSYGPQMGWSLIGSELVWFGDSGQAEDWKFGAYTTDSAKMDELTYTNMNYLAVWAMGNDRSRGFSSQPVTHYHIDGVQTNDVHNNNHWNSGGYGTVGFRAAAKNIVSVGAVMPLPNGWQGPGSVVMTHFSHWGPTDDGRIAPLICADGTNIYSTIYTNGTLGYATSTGTSPAAASVTGSIATLIERFRQFHREPTSATLRALLAQTADDAGNPGPDYKFGFGVMNTLRAAWVIMESAATYNAYSGQLLSDGHLLEHVLENGQTNDFIVVQAAGKPLKVTLTWTDPPGSPNSNMLLNPTNLMLVNNLELQVINPGNATNYPYSLNPANPQSNATTSGPNFRDNIEQVVVPAPVSDTFLTIRISHTGTLRNAPGGSVTNQPYSAWVDGNVVSTKPVIDRLVQTGSNTAAIAFYANVGSSYKVQSVDAVPAIPSAWTDVTGSLTAQYPLTAVEIPFSHTQPRRFYRVVLP